VGPVGRGRCHGSFQDDFSQRSNGSFQEGAKERLGSVDIEGRSG
jgi:hypothetical protein